MAVQGSRVAFLGVGGGRGAEPRWGGGMGCDGSLVGAYPGDLHCQAKELGSCPKHLRRFGV